MGDVGLREGCHLHVRETASPVQVETDGSLPSTECMQCLEIFWWTTEQKFCPGYHIAGLERDVVRSWPCSFRVQEAGGARARKNSNWRVKWSKSSWSRSKEETWSSYLLLHIAPGIIWGLRHSFEQEEGKFLGEMLKPNLSTKNFFLFQRKHN